MLALKESYFKGLVNYLRQALKKRIGAMIDMAPFFYLIRANPLKSVNIRVDLKKF